MALTLQKNQSVTLKKQDGSALTQVSVALGWDPAGSNGGKKGFFGSLFGGSGSIDLDSNILMLRADGSVYDDVYFGHLDSIDHSIHHNGDNLTGEGSGDDEVIDVDLTRVSPEVKALVVTITSYSRQTFGQVQNVYARVTDRLHGQGVEQVRYNLAQEDPNKTAKIVAAIIRTPAGWEFKALGVGADGRVSKDLVRQVQSLGL